jgi:hypothetical protein
METALMLISFVYEVESEKKLGCRPSSQKTIYSDDIHRICRYVGSPDQRMFCSRATKRSASLEETAATVTANARDQRLG